MTQLQQVKKFNRTYSLDTPVRVHLDDGRTVDTKLRAPAQLLGGHTAVVWLEGISGCYALNRVQPIPRSEA
jgi:hypothetical protein